MYRHGGARTSEKCTHIHIEKSPATLHRSKHAHTLTQIAYTHFTEKHSIPHTQSHTRTSTRTTPPPPPFAEHTLAVALGRRNLTKQKRRSHTHTSQKNTRLPPHKHFRTHTHSSNPHSNICHHPPFAVHTLSAALGMRNLTATTPSALPAKAVTFSTAPDVLAHSSLISSCQ